MRKLVKLGSKTPEGAARDFVHGLVEFGERLKGGEHCQDVSELFETFTATLIDASDFMASDGRARLHGVVAAGMPLAAKGGSGCSDCGLCEYFAKYVEAHLPA